MAFTYSIPLKYQECGGVGPELLTKRRAQGYLEHQSHYYWSCKETQTPPKRRERHTRDRLGLDVAGALESRRGKTKDGVRVGSTLALVGRLLPLARKGVRLLLACTEKG